MTTKLHLIKQWWRLIFTVTVPLVLLPLPLVGKSDEARCGYVIILLIVFWISGAIPASMTSLLPLVMFPMAGILKAKDVAPNYFADVVTFFFGSVTLAYEIQSVHLHQRAAFFVLRLVGSSPKWTMVAIMGTTGFISMWLNNGASTAIMLPVALELANIFQKRTGDNIDNVLEQDNDIRAISNGVNEMENMKNSDVILNEITIVPNNPSQIEKKCYLCPCWKSSSSSSDPPLFRRSSATSNRSEQITTSSLTKGFVLAVSFGSVFGGLTTIVGSQTTIFAKGFVDLRYANTSFQITFGNYLLYAFPAGVLMLIVGWLWLQILYNRKDLFQCKSNSQMSETQTALKNLLKTKREELGSIKWSEWTVGILFIIVVVLWVTKDFDTRPGWSVIFRKDYVSSGTIALLISLLPLVLPDSNPFKPNWTYKSIIVWSELTKHFPWSTLFLLGASLSIADAFTASRLTDVAANLIQTVLSASKVLATLEIIIISAVLTQVMGNLTIASIFYPIFDTIARANSVHPATYILPCTLAVSLALTLPISSQPNALIYGGGYLRIGDMLKSGIGMITFAVFIVLLAATSWMPAVFNINGNSLSLSGNLTTTFVFMNHTVNNTV